MSSEQAVLDAMGEDVWQRLAPVFASFDRVTASIEANERLLPPSENVVSYTTVYNIATDQRYDASYHHASRKLSELLYGHFQEMLATYARRLSLLPSSEDAFARVRAWGKFRTASRWACVVFRYLGCFFLNDSRGSGKYPPLDDVARAVFYNCCLKKHMGETRRAVFELIASARDGDQINVDILKSSVEMFERMSIPSQPTFFEEQFLVPFADATRDYFDRWAAARVARSTAAEYIQQCGRALHNESERFCLLFSARHHRARLLDEAEAALLDHRAARDLIFKSPTGLRSLLRARDFATASIAFKLLSTKKKRVEPVADLVAQQLEEDGRAELDARRGEAELSPHDVVTHLFALHETYARLLHDHFGNNFTIGKAVQTGLERIMSDGVRVGGGGPSPSSPTSSSSAAASSSTAQSGGGVVPISEILAQYCDYCIRQQDKVAAGEDGLGECLDRAVALLMFASSKDLFQLRARELLAKRLLAVGGSGSSSSALPSASVGSGCAPEELLIAKLKRACGSQFTSHYESMLADTVSSAQLQQKFVAYLATSDVAARLPLKIDFSALVLKIGIWPLRQDDNVLTIPRDVAVGIKHYIDFYRADSARRVLRWLHNHGSAVLIARYAKGLKEMAMTAFQAAILLHFSSTAPAPMAVAEGLTSPVVAMRTVREMMQATNLSEEQVRRSVAGLCRARVLLIASPQHHAKMGAAPGTIFFVNDQFTSPNRKLTIPSLVPKSTAVAASEALQAHAEEARRPIIQACLVKIMKSRRQIGHQELVGDAMRFLSNHFVPEASAVKEQIGALIERDIIKRHPSEQGVYLYVA